MLPEVLLIHKINLCDPGSKYYEIYKRKGLTMASGNWGWGGVGVGKGIVIFTRPLLVVNIGAACVQY